MKSALSLITLVAMVAFSVSVVAQESTTETKACSKCPSQKSTVATAAQEDGQCCPVGKAMAKLPKMTYKVGTETVCCSESAKALAEKHKSPIHFVVGDKTFEEKEKAYVSLVEQTESAVASFLKPSKCAASGTHTVAGKSCGCPMQAEQMAKKVKTATEKLTMTYVVGKESCGCAVKAGELAKKTGEKMTYKVGETSTCCSLEARLNLAHAKYKAAVKALAAKPATDKAAAKSGT